LLDRDVFASQILPAAYIREAVIGHLNGTRRILSVLRVRKTKFNGELHLQSLDISFPMFFEDCEFDEALLIWGSRFSTLSFENCLLSKGCDLRNSSIDGNLLMHGRFKSNGPLLLRDLKISGTCDLRGASLAISGPQNEILSAHAEGEVFAFSRSTAASLFWGAAAGNSAEPSNAARPSDIVTLRDAKVGAFRHDMAIRDLAAWPEAGKLVIDGFRYDRMDDAPRETLLSWLNLQSEPAFSSYHALANALENVGREADAVFVRSKLKRLQIARMKSPFQRTIQNIIFTAIDYGASPFRALALTFLCFILYLSFLANRVESNQLVPIGESLITESRFLTRDPKCEQKNLDEKSKLLCWRAVSYGPDETRYIPPNYPNFNQLEFTLEAFFPVVDLGQRKYWRPARQSDRLFLSALSILGLFFGSLFVASTTGLLTPREHR
jgi:hypothetical protein